MNAMNGAKKQSISKAPVTGMVGTVMMILMLTIIVSTRLILQRVLAPVAVAEEVMMIRSLHLEDEGITAVILQHLMVAPSRQSLFWPLFDTRGRRTGIAIYAMDMKYFPFSPSTYPKQC